MSEEESLRGLNDPAPRPPTWRMVAAVVVAIALPLALWDKRGAVVGLIALLVYGGALITATFNQSGTVAWSQRHVALDTSLIVPLTFLALAYLTTLSLGVCVLLALAAGAILLPVALWRGAASSSGLKE